ncbi:hypothetical protein RE0356_26630 [Prescottella equi]|nr:hypothetical protein RE0356_26630 [Prescottella equi]
MVDRDRQRLRLTGEDETGHQLGLFDGKQYHRSIDATGQHITERIAQRQLPDVYRSARVLQFELTDRPRNRIVDRTLKADSERRRRIACAQLRLFDDIDECAMGRRQGNEEVGPELGELDSSARACHQARTHAPLQCADQLTHAALRHEQPLSGSSEVQFLGESEKALDLAHG